MFENPYCVKHMIADLQKLNPDLPVRCLPDGYIYTGGIWGVEKSVDKEEENETYAKVLGDFI